MLIDDDIDGGSCNVVMYELVLRGMLLLMFYQSCLQYMFFILNQPLTLIIYTHLHLTDRNLIDDHRISISMRTKIQEIQMQAA